MQNVPSFDKSNIKDLMSRILFTLCILVICRICVHIPLPGVQSHVVLELVRKSGAGLLGMLDMFSGGAIANMSITGLGLMPYISSSIIVRLMCSVSEYLRALQKDGGDVGQRKINQYTRYGAVLIGLVQSFAVAKGLESLTSSSGISAVVTPGFFFRFTSVISLVCGTLFLMWLGERISARGIGNGSSVIIYSGIVANLPQSAYQTIQLGRTGAISSLSVILIILGIIGIFFFIVFVERSYRKVQVIQSRSARSGSMASSYIPIKINISGVIPPIFASSLLGLPQILLQFFASSDSHWVSLMMRCLSHGHPVFIVMYISLIVFFSFFYNSVVFNVEDMANGMQRSGAAVPGISPGSKTINYFNSMINRVTFIGAIYMSMICVIPELILSMVSLQFYLGGTSILIIVGVSMEIMDQVRSYMLGSKYFEAIPSWLRNRV